MEALRESFGSGAGSAPRVRDGPRAFAENGSGARGVRAARNRGPAPVRFPKMCMDSRFPFWNVPYHRNWQGVLEGKPRPRRECGRVTDCPAPCRFRTDSENRETASPHRNKCRNGTPGTATHCPQGMSALPSLPDAGRPSPRNGCCGPSGMQARGPARGAPGRRTRPRPRLPFPSGSNALQTHLPCPAGRRSRGNSGGCPPLIPPPVRRGAGAVFPPHSVYGCVTAP
jgi:hypothetical protein